MGSHRDPSSESDYGKKYQDKSGGLSAARESSLMA